MYKAAAAETAGPPFLITFLPDHHDEVQFLLRGAEDTPWAGMWFPMSEAEILFDDAVTTPEGIDVYRHMQLLWDIDGDFEPDYIADFSANNVYPPYGADYNGFVLARVWPCPGDLDHNLVVDLADLQRLLSSYGTTLGASFEEGDMDGDGDVDLADLQRLLSAYGTTCEPDILPGQDCWITPCGTTHHDFAQHPIPADFFGPGSDPFDGIISLSGDLLGPDTIVQRLEGMSFPEPLPATATVPTEIVQLDLVSCEPITVMIGTESSEWVVDVSLAPVPPPLGSLTATKTHANGGTYDATFFVQPVYVFDRIDAPAPTVVWDTAAQGIPPYEFQVFGAPWTDLEVFEMCTLDGFAPGTEIDPNGVPCGVDVCHDSPPPAGHDHCMRPAGYPLCPLPPGPCSACGPGEHWVDTCLGAVDTTPAVAMIGIDQDLDCIADLTFDVFGDMVVARSEPLDDSLQFPGLRSVDGHFDVIDTELVALDLTNGSSTIRVGPPASQPPCPGALAEIPDDPDWWVESFFDVYCQIDLPDGSTGYNLDPVPLQAIIDCVPPDAMYSSHGECLPLYDSPVPGAGTHIGNLIMFELDSYSE